MNNSTIHVKMDSKLAKALKDLSRKRETSVGELVRQAIFSCYQLNLMDLSENQRRAVEAFRGGYISLGKLSEEMGMSVWKTRKWLEEHNISQSSSYHQDDAVNA